MIKKLLVESERKPTTILLTAPFLLTFFKYYGSPQFYERYIAPLLSAAPWSWMYRDFYNFLAAFLLMMVIPAVLVKKLFREKLPAYGVQKGDIKYGLASVAVLFPLLALFLILPSSRMDDIRREYFLFQGMGVSPGFLIHSLVYGLYYFAFEFFFRGYLLFGLQERFGSFYSILIQTIPTCLIHIGKPDGEILASIFSGFLFGYLALRTKSIWYVFLLHWLIGVSLNVFIALL